MIFYFLKDLHIIGSTVINSEQLLSTRTLSWNLHRNNSKFIIKNMQITARKLQQENLLQK